MDTNIISYTSRTYLGTSIMFTSSGIDSIGIKITCLMALSSKIVNFYHSFYKKKNFKTVFCKKEELLIPFTYFTYRVLNTYTKV